MPYRKTDGTSCELPGTRRSEARELPDTRRSEARAGVWVQVELPPRPEVMSERRSVVQPRGELVTAQVVGADQGTDVAVLRVQVDRPLPVLSLGDSEKLNAGELVMAFGSPIGLANSVSMGVVSAGYEQIRRFGRVRRGEIGVRAQTITPELAQGLGLSQDWGVVLADVHPGGPAHEAGLQVGDIVLTLDDKVIENARQLQVNLHALNGAPVGSLVGLRTAVSEVVAGAPAVLHVERGGELLFVALTLE